MRRTTAASTEATDQSRTMWTALRAKRVVQSAAVYGSTTLLALKLAHILETTVEVGAGEQAVWPDVLRTLYGLQPSVRTQGALRLFSPAGLLVGSRTANEQAGGGSFGLYLPGLKSGDLVPGGGRGVMVGLAHSEDSRTNLGFAAYSGGDTELDVHLWRTVGARHELGSIEDLTSVPPGSHTQIPRVFEFIGLGDDTIEAIEAAVAVTLGGAIYPYATVIDNISGDPTAFTTAIE
jgi:hypothetical protein